MNFSSSLTYQWYQRFPAQEIGSTLLNNGTFSGVNTAVLTINTSALGQGQYYFSCAISNTSGTVSTNIVDYTVLPTPTSSPSTTGASGCGPQSFLLSASGAPGGSTYSWFDSSTGGAEVKTGSAFNTPVLNSTTTYYVAIRNSNSCDGPRKAVVAKVHPLPVAPTTTGDAICGSGSLTLGASGGTSGQYKWYAQASGGVPISGENGDNYSTPILSASTTYYVSIDNGTCESSRTAVTAQINIVPNKPATTGSAICGSGSLTLGASGGTNGQYKWYAQASGGVPISGENGDNYTTPILSASTTYYVSIDNGTCESSRTAVIGQINIIPNKPATTGSAICGSGSLTLGASGGTNGQYKWYTQASGGIPISGENGDNYTTPILSASTTYYVSIDNGTCESDRAAVNGVVHAIPDKPIINTNGVSNCGGNGITLSGPEGFDSYLWSTGATSQTITVVQGGEYTLRVIDSYGCTSKVSDALTIEDCNNSPPTITAQKVTSKIGGVVKLNLLELVADPDNNISLSTLRIVKQPESGAQASIDANENLTINYTGIAFSGVDRLVIRVCDLSGSCTEQTFVIDVVGDIIVYNGVSPNGDGKNDYLFLQNIDVLEETKVNTVSIYNRWGSLVFETNNYKNDTNAFRGLNSNGNELPAGIYFYKIEFASGKKGMTGYIYLRQ